MRVTCEHRVEAFQRWLRAVADEEEGNHHEDISLIARQVFNELKSDTNFGWLVRYLSIATFHHSAEPHRHRCSSGCSSCLADRWQVDVPLGLAYRVLRFTSPQLSAQSVQEVISTLTQLHDYHVVARTRCNSLACLPHDVGSCVALVHLGLTVLSWIGCRSCSLADVISSFSEDLQQLFNDFRLVLEVESGASDNDIDEKFSRNSLVDWVEDRWMAGWAGDAIIAATPPPTLCSSPQRSARQHSDSVHAVDVTPMKRNSSTSDFQAMDDDNTMLSCEKPVNNAAGYRPLQAPPSVRMNWVRELLGALLAHCRGPLLEALLQECSEEISDAGCEWRILHRVAAQWDIGLGTSLNGSYVSKAAATYFDAAQWLIGHDEKTTSTDNTSFVRNGNSLSVLSPTGKLSPDASPIPERQNDNLMEEEEPRPIQEKVDSKLTLTARHVVAEGTSAPTPSKQRPTDPSTRYEVELFETDEVADPPLTQNPSRKVRRKSQAPIVGQPDDDGIDEVEQRDVACACCSLM